MISVFNAHQPLTEAQWQPLLDQWIENAHPGRRVLLLPPDYSRCFSYAGVLCNALYLRLKDAHEVYVMPAVGTHEQMTSEEKSLFFPDIPDEAFLGHHWQTDTVTLGKVPGEEIARWTNGAFTQDISVQVNRHLTDGSFDTIVSIGQVLPHEVVGMANYTKNLLVGVGGREMINRSHLVGALCGIENILAQPDTPVRAIFDYAQQHYLDALGVHFFLTATQQTSDGTRLHGLFIGQDRKPFEAAAELSLQINVNWLEKRPERMVAYLDAKEFKSTWIGNKAIYRTRKAIADNGVLTVIAPGVRSFGENQEVDDALRHYGYCGTENVRRLWQEGAFEDLEMVAAHIMHSSPDGRFRVVYATDPTLLSPEDVRRAGFEWMDVGEAMARYTPDERATGYYTDEDGEYYFVSAPSSGLWISR